MTRLVLALAALMAMCAAGPRSTPAGDWLEGIITGAGDGGERYQQVRRHAEPAHMARLSIVEAHDFIVPGSPKNSLRYRIEPPGFTGASAEFRVLEGASVVRRIPGQPAGCGEHDIAWDGTDDRGNPLAAGTYAYQVSVTHAGETFTATLENRQVIEWGMHVVASDQPYGDSMYESGVDEATCTTSRFVTRLKPYGGEYVTIPRYDVVPDQGPGQLDAWIGLKTETGDWHIVYTTPAATAHFPALDYSIDLQERNGGICDNAGNQWDMKEPPDAIDTHVTATFANYPDGGCSEFAFE